VPITRTRWRPGSALPGRWRRGDHAGAEEEFRAVFAGRQRKLGPYHPETLIARFSVAQQMAERGNHAGAEEEFRGTAIRTATHARPGSLGHARDLVQHRPAAGRTRG
jgi:hypothetical protein